MKKDKLPMMVMVEEQWLLYLALYPIQLGCQPAFYHTRSQRLSSTDSLKTLTTSPCYPSSHFRASSLARSELRLLEANLEMEIQAITFGYGHEGYESSPHNEENKKGA